MTDSKDSNMTLPSDGERLLTTFGGSIADEHLHRYAVAMQHAANKDVLDIASGEGYGSFLLSQSARSVQGVDISATAIRHSTQKYTAPNLQFSEGSCIQIPFPDASFDLVVSFETIEHINEQFLFLSEIKRVLKPTGMLIISTPDKQIYCNESTYTNPHHQKELTHAEFTQLIKEHFSHVAEGKQFFNTGTTIIFDKATRPAKHYKGDYKSVYFQPYKKTGTYSLVIASDTSFESNSSIFTANDELLHTHGPEIQTSLDIINEDGALLSSEKQFSIPKQLQTLRFTIINKPLDEAAFRLSIKLSNKHAWVSLKQIRIMDESSCIIQWDEEFIRLKFEGKEGAIQTHQNSEWIIQPGAIILSPEISLKNNRAAQHVELKFEIDTDAWHIRHCQTAFDYQEINHELLENIEQKSKEIFKLSSEATHTHTRLTTLENLTNEFWEKDFRSRYLRPLSPLRKLTSRRYPLIERLLPPPKLLVDKVSMIRSYKQRINILRNALEIKLFNCARYLAEYPEIQKLTTNPFFHYLREGWPKGIEPKSCPGILNYLNSCFCSEITTRTAPPLPREPNPLVSIIVVNYNGKHHLHDLLTSLANQSYANHEIILVDNNSNDESQELIRQNWPLIKLVELPKNTGYAEGNNIGQEIATGRLLCLLNNDTIVKADWLLELVNEWREQDNAGAVCSKVVFWKPFISVEFKSLSHSNDLSVSRNSLRNFHPEYAKPIFQDSSPESQWIQFTSYLKIYLPHENAPSAIFTFKNNSNNELKLQMTFADSYSKTFCIPPGKHDFEIDLSHFYHSGQMVINNAGSEVAPNTLDTKDRGIFQPDLGQYETPEDISAICGCSVLIDPISIKGEPLFIPDFFAYYEDTELSLRIREHGYKLRYAPKSRVLHKHASSSSENSAFFRYHVARNKHYLNMLHLDEVVWRPILESSKKDLSQLRSFYASNDCSESEKEFGMKIPRLLQDLEYFEKKVTNGVAHKRTRRFIRIGIYNSYWNTFGGAEHHALMFAKYFSNYGIVELISESDFDMESLTTQFDICVDNCVKRIEPHVSTETTRGFDIFVNSTFCSSLESKAKISYYIISFPHRLEVKDVKQFLKSYKFLANSAFTQKWTKRYWNKSSEVVYPSIAYDVNSNISKKRMILNVGRFFTGGHNKKQLELAQNFAQLKIENKIPETWELVLAGKIQEGCEDYAEKIQSEFEQYGVKISADLAHADLMTLYSNALIYWHATGLDEDQKKSPHKLEHFGITTCEALAHNCIPIVHNCGGQPEIITHGSNGYIFNNEIELRKYTINLIKMYENNDEVIECMQKAAQKRAKDFDRNNFTTRMAKIHPYSESPLIFKTSTEK